MICGRIYPSVKTHARGAFFRHSARHLQPHTVVPRTLLLCSLAVLTDSAEARQERSWLKDGGAMQYVHANRFCQRCERRVNARLVRNITQSGVSQVYWYCTFGQHTISKPGTDFIPHEKIKGAGYDPDDLPVVNNYSGRELCAVCGSPFTELNHWAPRHLFGDEAERLPKDYLCKKHHDIWHATVTPNMTKVGSNGHL